MNTQELLALAQQLRTLASVESDSRVFEQLEQGVLALQTLALRAAN